VNECFPRVSTALSVHFCCSTSPISSSFRKHNVIYKCVPTRRETLVTSASPRGARQFTGTCLRKSWERLQKTSGRKKPAVAIFHLDVFIWKADFSRARARQVRRLRLRNRRGRKKTRHLLPVYYFLFKKLVFAELDAGVSRLLIVSHRLLPRVGFTTEMTPPV